MGLWVLAAVVAIALVAVAWSDWGGTSPTNVGTSSATADAMPTIPPGDVLAITSYFTRLPLVDIDSEENLYQVMDVHDAVSVSAAPYGDTAWAFAENGTLKGWGDNNHGRLGDGTTAFYTTPVAVVNVTDVTAVASSHHTTYALTADGVVWGWAGEDGSSFGQVPGAGRRVAPEPVGGLSDVTAIAASELSAYALTSDGTVWGWGYWCGADGSYEPVPVPGMSGAVDITGTGNGVAAVLEDGTVWWLGSSRTRGVGPCAAPTPTQIPGLGGIVDIDGYDSIVDWNDGLTAITTTGDLWRADLPRGDADSWTVRRIPLLREVVQAPAGTEYALCADGTVWQYEDEVTQLTQLPPVRSIDGNGTLLYLVVGR